MAVRPKLMMGAGIAIAGLGLIGAGAGATFTAQVGADTTISSGGLGLSLNGETGSDLHLGVDAKNLGSHFTPISKDLMLKNTGTLDMVSNFVSVTATGCDGGTGAPLAQALHVKLTDVTDNNKQVYDGALCSLVRDSHGQDADHGQASDGHGQDSENHGQDADDQWSQGFTTPAHKGVGGQLPYALKAGQSRLYRLVIQPKDAKDGLPTEAQYTRTSVNLVFTGFDY